MAHHPISRRVILRSAPVALLAIASAGRITRAASGDDRFASGDTVEVAVSALNLRRNAGLDAEVLTVLHQGTAGTILKGPVHADGYEWYRIDAGQPGWVAGEYLMLADTGNPGGLRIEVVDGPLNLREDPSLSGEILTTIPAGGTMRVTQADGGTWSDGYHWIAVQLEDQDSLRGFIADAFTAPV